jgi:16S rRNA (guanine1207-N2)-methyltransferase
MSLSRTAAYGQPDHELAPVSADAIQLSPLVVGATDLASIDDLSLDEIAIRAPAGVVERRFALAQALRA